MNATIPSRLTEEQAAPWVERLGAENDLEPLEWLNHHARYLFACQFTAGCDVLDLACGTGYGSALLRRHGARSVTGVDLAPEAIAEARRLHSAPGITFLEGNMLDPPVAGPFGAVVSFETIEHVSEPERALDALVRRLAPDGVLVCSTPDRNVTNPGKSRLDAPLNPFHGAELSRSELQAALTARFREVRLYGQYHRLPGRVRERAWAARANRVLAAATIWPTRLPLRSLYVVAVCRGAR